MVFNPNFFFQISAKSECIGENTKSIISQKLSLAQVNNSCEKSLSDRFQEINFKVSIHIYNYIYGYAQSFFGVDFQTDALDWFLLI